MNYIYSLPWSNDYNTAVWWPWHLWDLTICKYVNMWHIDFGIQTEPFQTQYCNDQLINYNTVVWRSWHLWDLNLYKIRYKKLLWYTDFGHQIFQHWRLKTNRGKARLLLYRSASIWFNIRVCPSERVPPQIEI
jgi:hypothetical protein